MDQRIEKPGVLQDDRPLNEEPLPSIRTASVVLMVTVPVAPSAKLYLPPSVMVSPPESVAASAASAVSADVHAGRPVPPTRLTASAVASTRPANRFLYFFVVA